MAPGGIEDGAGSDVSSPSKVGPGELRCNTDAAFTEDERRAAGCTRTMTGAREIGPVIVVIGLAVVAIGAVAWLGGVSWFGRLPGDLRIERDGLRVFIPLTSMLVISAVLSLFAALLRRLW